MAQKGNNNAARGNRWRSAIEKAIEHYPEVPPHGKNELMRGIYRAAYEFVDKMIEDKDIAFFREFGDRLDGKPKQSMEIEGGEKPIEVIERRIIKDEKVSKD